MEEDQGKENPLRKGHGGLRKRSNRARGDRELLSVEKKKGCNWGGGGWWVVCGVGGGCGVPGAGGGGRVGVRGGGEGGGG